MIRPRPRNVLASGILLVGVAGCAGLRREPPPMIGPGVMATPIATSAQPVQETGVTPFAEPGGGIGRFVPGRYQQIKEAPKAASRWVDPFVQRRRSQPERVELTGIFPQRQPIGSRPMASPLQDESIETLPIALNIPVHPDDDPIETAQAPGSTRRLSARVEPEVRPSRWRVPQPEPETPEGDTPAEPRPPQARHTSPPTLEVPRERLAFELFDEVSKPEPQPEPNAPAPIDTPVEAASATGSVDEFGLLEIPEDTQLPATEEVPASEPISQPLIDEPQPLSATDVEPAKAEEAPATEPVDEPEPLKASITEAPATAHSDEPEPLPASEVTAAADSESSRPEPITEPAPHPAAETEPPPFVPGTAPEPNAEDDGIFAEPPPLSHNSPGSDARSALPHPPVPSPYMVAASPAPTSDPATKRIATEVTETSVPKAKAKPKSEKPARRTLWSRFMGEEPKTDRIAEAPFHPAVYPSPGIGLANMPPALFLPSYYGQGADAKRDDDTQKVSTEPSDKTEKSTDSKPRHFRLFRRLRGE